MQVRKFAEWYRNSPEGLGGYVQQYQIDIDPNKLRGVNIPLSTVVQAVQKSNNNG